MALSGTTAFNRNTLQIITRALRTVGAVSVGNDATTAQKSSANEALQSMVKGLQTQGVMLWTREEVPITIAAASEVDGTDSEIYTCIKPHTSSATTKPVTGAGWREYWAKKGVTGGTWADATAYTASNVFTVPAGYIQLEKVYIREDGNDEELTMVMYDEYLGFEDKFESGKPYMVSFSENITSNTGLLYPYPDSTAYGLYGLGTRILQDMDDDADDPDFPARWINVLHWGLVSELAMEYGRDAGFIDRAERKFNTALNDAQKNNSQIADRTIHGAYPVGGENGF